MKSIILDDETYSRILRIAESKQSMVVDEISLALKRYLELEENKLRNIKENKQLLCEG
jgi:hypothetical protein